MTTTTDKAERARLRDLRSDVAITFRTADGFELSYNKQTREFTDGDLTFDADSNGWPIGSDDLPLEGQLRRHNYGSDRTILLDDEGTRTVIQHYGDGESWHKTIAMPLAVYEAWKAEMQAEGFKDCYLDPMACLEYKSHVMGEHYSGAGRAWANAPALGPATARCIIATQRGGLDI